MTPDRVPFKGPEQVGWCPLKSLARLALAWGLCSGWKLDHSFLVEDQMFMNSNCCWLIVMVTESMKSSKLCRITGWRLR